MPRKLTKTRPKQGERLADLRKAAQLTQHDLAKLIGVSQTNIAYWEQSDKPPRSDVLPKLAEVLGVDAAAFLYLNEPHARRRGAGPVGLVRRAFDEVSRLPRREQKKVVETVNALVNQYRSQAS